MNYKKYINYSAINYLAFNYAGFACIAIIVFLTATQPFILKKLLELNLNLVLQKIKNWTYCWIVGIFDELTAMIVAPLLGALNDNLNIWNYSGSKLFKVQVF